MLRVIRTELYFNPLEIKWQFPELIISNPGISAAFFHCDPMSFDIDKVISRPIFDTTGAPSDLLGALQRLPEMRPQVVAAFLDTALQNAPFHWSDNVLNPDIIRSIYNEPFIIERSPPEGIQFGKLLSGASFITVGTFVGFQGVGGGPLLFLAVPAGILIVGAAVAIVHAFDKGLTHAVERAIRSKDKTPPRSTATTTRRK